MLFKAAAVLSLASFALASPQAYGPPVGPAAGTTTTSSAAPAPSVNGQVFVQVGANSEFIFSPSDITAPQGTLVTFTFSASIVHSVTQSSFENPCTPATGGFSSGLQPSGNSFTVNVTDASTPIYLFCEFPLHCSMGMVATINAPSSGNGSNAAFVSAAQAIGTNEAVVSNTLPVTGGVGAIATAGPTSGTPTISGAAAASSAAGGSSSGAAPLAVGNVAAVLGAVAVVFGIAL